MSQVFRVALLAAVGAAAAGCATQHFDGPTVDAFNGRVVHHGEPVSFPEGELVILKVFHETGRSFSIPLQPDGSFKIRLMPIGKYSAMLSREPKDGTGAPTRYNVPGGLTIEVGKTEYTIELGDGWKP